MGIDSQDRTANRFGYVHDDTSRSGRSDGARDVRTVKLSGTCVIVWGWCVGNVDLDQYRSSCPVTSLILRPAEQRSNSNSESMPKIDSEIHITCLAFRAARRQRSWSGYLARAQPPTSIGCTPARRPHHHIIVTRNQPSSSTSSSACLSFHLSTSAAVSIHTASIDDTSYILTNCTAFLQLNVDIDDQTTIRASAIRTRICPSLP